MTTYIIHNEVLVESSTKSAILVISHAYAALVLFRLQITSQITERADRKNAKFSRNITEQEIRRLNTFRIIQKKLTVSFFICMTSLRSVLKYVI